MQHLDDRQHSSTRYQNVQSIDQRIEFVRLVRIHELFRLGWARRGTLTEVEEVLLELGRSLAGLSNGPLSRFSHLCGYGREKSDVGPGERSRSRRVFLTVKLRWHLDRSPPFDHTIVECTPLAEPPRMAIRAPFANLDTGPLEVFCFVRNARRAR